MSLARFKKRIKNRLSNNYSEIIKYFPITKKELFLLLLESFWVKLKLYQKDTNKKNVINLIITSKAEERIFSPLLTHILENSSDLKINVFCTEFFCFDDHLVKLIIKSNNINLRRSGYFLLKSVYNPYFINVICLDFALYVKHHRKGCEIIDFLNKYKSKTLCIQHGGNQEDNIQGQITSKSKYQIVFGQIIYERLIKAGRVKSKIFLTGNPLHDVYKNEKFVNSIKKKKKVISLISCLHTEYDYKANSYNCYLDYIRNIYKSIDYKKYQLVIKMHPNDTIKPNLYELMMEELNLNSEEISIIYPSDKITAYHVIIESDLVISRSSSIIEEALIVGKKVLGYDLFLDGPSKSYDFLQKYHTYKKVIGDYKNLKSIIDEFINENMDISLHLEELILNTTFKLDGKSTKRVVQLLEKL